jgi:hypothetical protein
VRAAAKLAGIDRDTWAAIEEGTRNTQPSKYAGIERALGWGAGSIEAILDGGDPKPITRGGPAHDLDLQDLREKVEWFRTEAEVFEADRELDPEIRMEMVTSLRRSYVLYRRLLEQIEERHQSGQMGTETA